MNTQKEDRIKSVEDNLLYESSFVNKGYKAASLLERMMYYKVPGVSIAVINDFKIDWVKGYGTKEVCIVNGIDENTLFQAASISKSVFSAMVMCLVNKGVLSLDENVDIYLKQWKVPINDGWEPNISLRQLLSHTAGLTVHGFKGYKTTEQIPNLIQILNGYLLCNNEPVVVNTIPGLQYRYSGGGYTVAQQIISDVVGKPIPQLIKEIIFDPLGMNNSTFQQPLPPFLENQAAVAHSFTDKPIEGKWHIHPEMAAAGLWTTPSDLAKFGIALQLALKGESNVFPKDIAEEMLMPQVEDHYGLGFRLYGSNLTARFGHSGSNEGYRSRMTFYKTLGMGAVIMINSWREELISELERAIATAYGWPDFLPVDKIACDVPVQLLENYAGEYISESGMIFNIISIDGLLSLGFGKQLPLIMHSISQYEFIIKEVNVSVSFILTSDGVVERLAVHQNGRRVDAIKVR
jgi:CubicO group peptidase (beta-lactamase class C family)